MIQEPILLSPATRELRVTQVSQVTQGPTQQSKETPGPRVIPGPAPPATQEPRVAKATPENRATQARALRETPAQPEILGPQGILELPEIQELRETPALEHRATPGQQVAKATLEHRAIRVQVPRVTRVQPAARVTPAARVIPV